MFTSKKKVVFIGLACLDIVNICHSYPLEDSDQRLKDQRWQCGGNAVNSAVVFRKLLRWRSNQEIEVEYLGSVAQDIGASFIRNELERNDIVISNLATHPQHASPTSCVIINSQNGSRTIVHSNKGLPEVNIECVEKLDIENVFWIHFEGRTKNVANIKSMLKIIRERDLEQNITISVELEKPEPLLVEFMHAKFDVYFISKDFLQMLGYFSLEESTFQSQKRVPKNSNLICTWGEKGASVYDERLQSFHFSKAFPPRQGVKDTLGAGDSFLAATIFAKSVLNYTYADSITFGCKVAGAKCAMDAYDDIENFEKYIEYI